MFSSTIPKTGCFFLNDINMILHSIWQTMFSYSYFRTLINGRRVKIIKLKGVKLRLDVLKMENTTCSTSKWVIDEKVM